MKVDISALISRLGNGNCNNALQLAHLCAAPQIKSCLISNTSRDGGEQEVVRAAVREDYRGFCSPPIQHISAS